MPISVPTLTSTVVDLSAHIPRPNPVTPAALAPASNIDDPAALALASNVVDPPALPPVSNVVDLAANTAMPTHVALAPMSPAEITSDATPITELINRFLPSGLPPILRVSDVYLLFADKERYLWLAQAEDSLEDIRRVRRILAGISQFKRLNVSGTGNCCVGRIRSLYDRFVAKLDQSIIRYQTTRSALLVLDPNGSWKHRLRVLCLEDNRGPGREDDKNEGRYEPSWIWLAPRSFVPPDNPSASDLHSEMDQEEREYIAAMRVEWARMKAWSE
ncbi:hypothetical protein C8Q80DRAFT_1270219 [Daedaleopsis nitida]|nr:hypothetical protein C8Q80DRAFT_1270219 [Daedaleopsis nitida]